MATNGLRVPESATARSPCWLHVLVGVQAKSYRLGHPMTRFMALEIFGREIAAIVTVKEGLVDLPDVETDDSTDTHVVDLPSAAFEIKFGDSSSLRAGSRVHLSGDRSFESIDHLLVSAERR